MNGSRKAMVRFRSLSALPLLLAATALVCAAPPFQTDSTNAAAVVTRIDGQVSVLRDSQPWALDIGSQVKPQQIIITGPDGYAEFKCSDGSTFEVFPNSRVTFRNHPGDWKDLLEMWIGRVKVHIQKLNGQPNNNRVKTPTAIISVRGTIFDVSIEDEDTTYVEVAEGQVAVQHAIRLGEPQLLNPGEWIRVYKNIPLAQRQMIDRGSVIRAAMRAAADAIYTTISNGPKAGGGAPPSGGGGGGLPGDHGGKKPPPQPPSSGGNPPPSNPPSDAGGGAPPPPSP